MYKIYIHIFITYIERERVRESGPSSHLPTLPPLISQRTAVPRI